MIGRGSGGDHGERPLTLGPSGRPLHPVGALFEAAFRRFGQRMGAYLLYSVAFALPAAAAAWAIDVTGEGGPVVWFLFLFPFFAGHLALVGTLSGLVTGQLRERAGSIAVTVAVGALVLAVVGMLLPPLALIPYAFVVFGPIAAAAGDRRGLGAMAQGARVAWRHPGRAGLVVFGLVLLALFLWFGFVIALSPVEATARKVVSFSVVTLVTWPVAALVERNLYGDLTGRLVIREASGEDARRADLERRGRRRD